MTNHIGAFAGRIEGKPMHRQEHARYVRNLRRWYWYWRSLSVQAHCRHDYNQVPATREWMIDAGYCLDNTTKGM